MARIGVSSGVAVIVIAVAVLALVAHNAGWLVGGEGEPSPLGRPSNYRELSPAGRPSSDRTYASPIPTSRLVSPTAELDDMMKVFEEGLPEGAEAAALAEAEIRLIRFRERGGTLWRSERWMRSPEYYKKLKTPQLAQECFAGAVFGIQLAMFDDPRFGVQCLRIMHNGFGELLNRSDLSQGMLAAYDYYGSQLDPSADLSAIVVACQGIQALRRFYCVEPFRTQVAGREGMFLEANIGLLKRFQSYLRNYDPKTIHGAVPFYCEPCSVAQVSLLLLAKTDPPRYEKIAPRIRSVSWSGEQRLDDIADFINLVLTCIGPDHEDGI